MRAMSVCPFFFFLVYRFPEKKGMPADVPLSHPVNAFEMGGMGPRKGEEGFLRNRFLPILYFLQQPSEPGTERSEVLGAMGLPVFF